MRDNTAMRCCILGGRSIDKTCIADIEASDIRIGADRGALWCVRQHLPLDVAIGDFDSVTESERGEIEKQAQAIQVYPSKKDQTDLDLAVSYCIERYPKATVRLYGCTGGRLDHTFGAIAMLLRLASHNIDGQIVDNSQKIHIVRRQLDILPDSKFRYVSVLAYGGPVTVDLSGFLYNGRSLIVPVSSTRGISNEIVSDTARISVSDGTALVIESSEAAYL